MYIKSSFIYSIYKIYTNSITLTSDLQLSLIKYVLCLLNYSYTSCICPYNIGNTNKIMPILLFQLLHVELNQSNFRPL